MPAYNTKFELSLEDMELIESALRRAKHELTQRARANHDEIPPADPQVRDIQQLLGRLHNQKVFYRPRGGVYVGG